MLLFLSALIILKLGSRSSRATRLSHGMRYTNGVCVWEADSLPPPLLFVWDASGRLHSCHGESKTQDKRPLLEQEAV